MLLSKYRTQVNSGKFLIKNDLIKKHNTPEKTFYRDRGKFSRRRGKRRGRRKGLLNGNLDCYSKIGYAKKRRYFHYLKNPKRPLEKIEAEMVTNRPCFEKVSKLLHKKGVEKSDWSPKKSRKALIER